jgi:glycosyltransferase involved in cell wall biosynthesis
MKIGIDLQALQTQNSKNRGIGRYTQSILEVLLTEQNSLEYQLYANKTLPEPELDRDIFPYSYINYPNIGSCDINDLLMKTTFSASGLDGLFIPSPMEGLDSTIPNFSDFHKKVFVICYDLIPLIFADRYLDDLDTRYLYMKRLENIRNADFVFAISESTRQDTIKYLNKSPDKVLNISGGVSRFFVPISINDRQAWLKVFAEKFNINKQFILYTGGEDWRKNIEGAIEAFAKLPEQLRESHQLVIACKVSAFFTNEINILAVKLGIERSLILTNYVTDLELRALYSTCSLFVFPSFYEGFGLPLLEALACGAPAIASNNSSLPEILGASDRLFDPHSSADVARAMQEVLSNQNLQSRLSEHALERASKFTWQSVTRQISDVLLEHQPLQRISISFSRVTTDPHKSQLAFFSPFKPIKSGISDYSYDLLPSLSQQFNVYSYHDEDYLPDLMVADNLSPHSQFERNLVKHQYEAIIYQIGNSSYHAYMYSQLMKYCGISVLHDYYLGGLISYIDTHQPQLGIKLFNELEHSYGNDKAIEIRNLIQQDRLSIDSTLPESGIYMNRRIFTRSLGVVLHSKWAYDVAVKNHSHDNNHIACIPHLVPAHIPQKNSVEDIRTEFNIPIDSLVVSTFGFINSTKRPLSILQAFKQYLSSNRSAILIFVGGTEYLGSLNLESEIQKLGLKGNVKITGHVNMPDFYKYIEVSDICLNLRFPFKGESSGSLLRILSVGKPTVVTDIGSFADFPDDVVLKIPQPNQSNEVEEIYKALTLLTENTEYRNSLSAGSSAYIAREHSPQRCADLYADFVKQVIRSPESKQKMLADWVGRESANLNISNPKLILTSFSKVIGANTI